MATLLITKQTGNFFSLQLNSEDAIISEQNRLTTVGNICHFKTVSGANIIKSQNISYSDITLVASGSFTFASINALWLKLIEVGFFDGLATGGGSGGGVDNFTELLDTFNSYIGRDGQALVVNESELKIETVPFANISAFTDLSDAPSPLLPNKMIVTNALGTALIMTDLPTTPETYLNAVGTFHYADASSLVTPQAITASTPVKIENDGLGVYTNISNAPYGISVIYNIVTGQLDFSQLSIGDDVIFSPDLLITTSAVNQTLRVYLKMAIGSGAEWEKPLYQIEKKTSGDMVTGYVAAFDISEEATKNYPAELWIETDASADVVNNGYYFKVTRKNINIVDLPTSIRQDVDFGVISSDAVDAINNAIPNILIQDQNLGQIKIQGTFNGVYHEYLFTGIKGYYGNGALQCTSNDLIEIGGSGGGGSETTATMGALIGSAGNATPNDSDYVATALTGGGLLKKITWTNVKAFLKTYFDTIYTNTSDVATQISTALSGYLTSSTAASTYEPLKGTDDNYVTDAEKVIIGNTSGTNTGDQDLSGLQPKGVRITNATTTGSYAVDWNAADVWKLTLTGATTITDSNLPTGTATKVIEFLVTGSFSLGFPLYWVALPSSQAYDGAKQNHIVISCIVGTSGSEIVFYSNEPTT